LFHLLCRLHHNPVVDRHVSDLTSHLFHTAEISFPDRGTMHLTIPDSIVAREKSEILEEYLHKVFCERCGMDLIVDMEFVEREDSTSRKDAEVLIEKQAEMIAKRVRGEQEEAPAAEKQEDTFVFYVEDGLDYPTVVNDLFIDYPQHFFSCIKAVNNSLSNYSIDESNISYFTHERSRIIAVELHYY
jgi:hypothetical protein